MRRKPRAQGVRCVAGKPERMEQRIDKAVSPYRVFSRAEWAALRQDTPMTLDLGGGHATALAARPARHARGRRDLSAPVTTVVDLRRGDAGAVSCAAGLSRHRRRQDAVHHRRRRVGRGRQIDHRARPAGAAGALAECAEGRPYHHRRLSLSERGSGERRADGEERISRKLRSAGAAAVFIRRESRSASGARAGLFAPGL